MVSQEEVFDFFQKMSIKLHNDGYRILDNLVHEFPKIKYEEEIILEKREDEIEDEIDYSSE